MSGLAKQLADFRTAHPPAALSHGGVEWRYVRGGTAGPPILLLTGALGLADLGFVTQSRLERHHRIVAPNYPNITSARELLDGLLRILDAEGVNRAHLVGGSFGGLIAQRLSQYAPSRVASIALTHTGVAEAAGASPLALAMVRRIPARWMMSLMTKRLRGFLAGADPEWFGLFDQEIRSMDHGAMLARLALGASLARWRDGTVWAGPTLIVESDDDPAVRPAQRAALRARYPQAQVVTFAKTGHLTPILDPDGYCGRVIAFLAGVVT